MGVPAFYRWLSAKYDKIVIDYKEETCTWVEGQAIPVDLCKPNPNGMEFDNLYIDMNGIIHPCAHPEGGPQPETEEEMYINVMKYVDRLFAAVRPRKVLFLAIDGVAPRAKMNQQRSRRFKSAQEAKEKDQIKAEIREDMMSRNLPVPPEDGPMWDSNVITPGTQFMHRLSEYLHYYVQLRLNTNKYWRNIKVLFSDANEPGEGEHKIMSYVRRQRSQPGYDPNTTHVLHGLDADLIMLGLATHEVKFAILREQVTFGRKDREKRDDAAKAQQAIADSFAGKSKEKRGSFGEHDGDELTSKPLQLLRVWVLREYLDVEFGCLSAPGALPFPYDFERIVDDFVFLCFFVGNDFLPHLPSLSIRDGALDFLQNVYKHKLGSMGDYLTRPGGKVNLKGVEVMLAAVGEIEDEVFRSRKVAEQNEQARRERGNTMRRAGGKHASVASVTSVAPCDDTTESAPSSYSTCCVQRHARLHIAHVLLFFLVPQGRVGAAAARPEAVPVGSVLTGRYKDALLPHKRPATEQSQSSNSAREDANKSAAARLRKPPSSNLLIPQSSATGAPTVVEVEAVKEEPEPPKPEPPKPVSTLKDMLKDKEQKQLDQARDSVQDTVRLHEAGWKDRYYSDKCKVEDIEAGGGRERVFQTYVEGLCWVMQYYYQGVTDWTWYYPFHYAPFASDLVQCSSYTVEFTNSKPFRPIEQLMAVLPSASAPALPPPCRKLMMEKASPIIDFYPEEVKCDPNGKPMPWLWVVLLPFIDEKRLLNVVKPLFEDFTPEERHRNRFGPAYVFVNTCHPMAKASEKALAGDASGEGVWLPAEENDGFSGTLTAPEFESMKTTLGAHIQAPQEPSGALEDIRNNQVTCCAYALPPSLPHKSELLPGAVVAEPQLKPQDRTVRRAPRMGRGGINISEWGAAAGSSGGNQQQRGQQQYNNRNSHDGRQQPGRQNPQHGVISRMIRAGLGGGVGAAYWQQPPPPPRTIPGYQSGYGPPPGQLQQQQQQQGGRYAARPSQPYRPGSYLPPEGYHGERATGLRGWGSMEPMPKQQQQPRYAQGHQPQHYQPPQYYDQQRQGQLPGQPRGQAPGNHMDSLRQRLASTLAQQQQQNGLPPVRQPDRPVHFGRAPPQAAPTGHTFVNPSLQQRQQQQPQQPYGRHGNNRAGVTTNNHGAIKDPQALLK
ncbi:unnamed protein product [Chrysoparadoxa australica]